MFPSLSRPQRPRKHFRSGGALVKRGTFVYDQNQTILCRSQAKRKFGVSITSEMVLTESLLLRKGHFFPAVKRGRSFKKYFFRSVNGALWPPKSALFSLLKNAPLPPRFRGPCPSFKGYLYEFLGKPLIESLMY